MGRVLGGLLLLLNRHRVRKNSQRDHRALSVARGQPLLTLTRKPPKRKKVRKWSKEGKVRCLKFDLGRILDGEDHKIGRQSGRYPIAVTEDAVYFTSPEPDPRTAAPEGMEFKPESDALRLCCDSARSSRSGLPAWRRCVRCAARRSSSRCSALSLSA
jgi:hypothetical protein